MILPLLFFVVLLLAPLATLPAANMWKPAVTPNIVIILADDLGYGDVRCYNPGRGKNLTPHIDSLAAQGMRFTDGHSSSGVCSPSRYSLLTGRYHWRTRLQSGIVAVFGEALISPERLTIASLARQHGYRTACIGKWHLGWDWPIPREHRSYFDVGKTSPVTTAAHQAAWRAVFSQRITGGPTSRGFDEYFGVDIPNWPPFCFIQDDRTVGIPTEFLPERLLQNNQASVGGPALKGWSLEPTLPALGDHAVKFIARQAQARQPFLLYLSLTSPHTPLAVNEPWRGRSGLNAYADFVMETDALVGRVVDALNKSAVAKDTMVIFTSDNGCAPYIGTKELEEKGHFPSGPLRGYKGDAWEGGHRVPFIVRWPQVVKPGSVCSQTVGQVDLMATMADLLGESLPNSAGEDSVSLVPLLRGIDQPIHEAVVHQSITGVLAIRAGKWKLQFGPGSGGRFVSTDADDAARRKRLPELQLYDLEADLGETTNLQADKPDVVERVTGIMAKLIAEGRSTPGAAQKNDVTVRWAAPAKTRATSIYPKQP